MKITAFTDELPLTLGARLTQTEAEKAQDRRDFERSEWVSVLREFQFVDHSIPEHAEKPRAGPSAGAAATNLDHEPSHLHCYLHQVKDEDGNVADAPEEGLIQVTPGRGCCFVVKMASITDNDMVTCESRGRVRIKINPGLGFELTSEEPAYLGKFDVRYRVVRRPLHGCNPCSEIILRDKQLCNLTEELTSFGKFDVRYGVVRRPEAEPETVPSAEERKVEKKKELAAAYGAGTVVLNGVKNVDAVTALNKAWHSGLISDETYYSRLKAMGLCTEPNQKNVFSADRDSTCKRYLSTTGEAIMRAMSKQDVLKHVESCDKEALVEFVNSYFNEYRHDIEKMRWARPMFAAALKHRHGCYLGTDGFYQPSAEGMRWTIQDSNGNTL